MHFHLTDPPPDTCWALVAVKRRAECKGRLAGRLAAEARLSLVRLMLERVLTALRAARTIDRIVVVSPERDTVPSDIPVLEDSGHGLNAVLDTARQTLVDRGMGELVVLPADLPMITAADIDALVESGRRTGFALATDIEGMSTNGLYLAAPAAFRFHFGPGSRLRHFKEAMRLGLKPELVRAPGLEFDLDMAEDLSRLRVRVDPTYALLPLAADGGPCLTQTRCG
ncbi:MAG: 2-phospho-L-lactate guanylyltransferase [Planctomycetes bacterium]|nr:2-phospho-L-lactate guanylyltransferase [Planctomycetota bacterium]